MSLGALRGPTVVDLFSGAGLFSYGFVKEGFQVIRAIEMNDLACATYAANLGSHIECADVQIAQPRGRCDVLIAGPPCQGFSTLNIRRARDPRNLLSLEVVRWARVLRPRVVVVENVAAFLLSPVWGQLAKELEGLGYDVAASEHNALDYGVPQLRRRSFTVATRGGITIPNPKPLRGGFKTVQECWEGLAREPNGVNLHMAPKPSEIALARMKVIPYGGDKRDVMRNAPNITPRSWWEVKCQATDVWGRLWWDRPANTLRTTLQNPSKGRYLHPEQHRAISLREAARLHSIPDEWTFVGRPYPVAKQIGNSVPPRLARSIARAIRSAL